MKNQLFKDSEEMIKRLSELDESKFSESNFLKKMSDDVDEETARFAYLQIRKNKKRRNTRLNTKKDKGVYWCTRDLDGSPMGNHHFLLLIGDKDLEIFGDYIMKEENRNYFYTFGGFDNDFLWQIVNNPSDVTAVREGLNPDLVYWWKPDYDFESHHIDEFTEADFNHIIKHLNNYYLNQENGKVPKYNMRNCGCATWMNILLKSLGVSKEKRKQYADFKGVDWAENDAFDTKYFKQIIE